MQKLEMLKLNLVNVDAGSYEYDLREKGRLILDRLPIVCPLHLLQSPSYMASFDALEHYKKCSESLQPCSTVINIINLSIPRASRIDSCKPNIENAMS